MYDHLQQNIVWIHGVYSHTHFNLLKDKWHLLGKKCSKYDLSTYYISSLFS